LASILPTHATCLRIVVDYLKGLLLLLLLLPPNCKRNGIWGNVSSAISSLVPGAWNKHRHDRIIFWAKICNIFCLSLKQTFMPPYPVSIPVFLSLPLPLLPRLKCFQSLMNDFDLEAAVEPVADIAVRVAT
jgi:hypothetical protein